MGVFAGLRKHRTTEDGAFTSAAADSGGIKPRVAPTMSFSQFEQGATLASTLESKAAIHNAQIKELKSDINSYVPGGAISATQYQAWESHEKTDTDLANSETTDARKIDDRLSGYSITGAPKDLNVAGDRAVASVQRHDLTTATEDKAEATALQEYQNGKGISSLNGLNTTERNTVTSIEHKATEKTDGNYFTPKDEDLEHSYLKSAVSSLEKSARHDDDQSFALGKSVDNYDIKRDDTEMKKNAAALLNDAGDVGKGKIGSGQYNADQARLDRANNTLKDQIAGIHNQEKSWAYSTANTTNINQPTKEDDKTAAAFYKDQADKNMAGYFSQSAKTEESTVSREEALKTKYEAEHNNGVITPKETQAINNTLEKIDNKIATAENTESYDANRAKTYTAAATKNSTTEPAFLKSSSYKAPASVRHLEVTAGDGGGSLEDPAKTKVSGDVAATAKDPAQRTMSEATRTSTTRGGVHSTHVHGASKTTGAVTTPWN